MNYIGIRCLAIYSYLVQVQTQDFGIKAKNVKVQIFWEGRIYLKEFRNLFWYYEVIWKQWRSFFQILWPSLNIWTLLWFVIFLYNINWHSNLARLFLGPINFVHNCRPFQVLTNNVQMLILCLSYCITTAPKVIFDKFTCNFTTPH